MNAQLRLSFSQLMGACLHGGAVASTFCYAWNTWITAVYRAAVVMLLLSPAAVLPRARPVAAGEPPLQEPLNPSEEVTPSEDTSEQVTPSENEEESPYDDEVTEPGKPEDDFLQQEEVPTPEATSPVFIRPQDACPENLQRLVDGLLQDLPTYTELVASRSLGLRTERFSPFGMVILASEADYEPIELAENPYGDNDTENIQQVFFTTLERQYWQGRPFSLQNYHWLFLVRANNGWYLSQMYSSVGGYPAEPVDAPSPPQETSEGIIGQAVTLWLRDCRAGAVFPPDGGTTP